MRCWHQLVPNQRAPNKPTHEIHFAVTCSPIQWILIDDDDHDDDDDNDNDDDDDDDDDDDNDNDDDGSLSAFYQSCEAERAETG